MLERQLVLPVDFSLGIKLVDKYLAGLDPADLGVGDPLDMTVAEFMFEHALRVTDTAEPEMADIRFAGHKGDRHAVAHLPAAQGGIQNGRVLVGRPEAAGKLYRADDHRPRARPATGEN